MWNTMLKPNESLSAKSHNCCTPQPKGKAACPKCSKISKGVLPKILKSLLKDSSKETLHDLEGFFLCHNPACEVVYFRSDDILTQKHIRITIGFKEGASPATVCYCFGWTKEKIKAELETTGETNVLEDIKAKMKNQGCSCEIRNPSGKCCLGDISQVIKEIKMSLT